LNRRDFLAGGAALALAGKALAFPSRNLRVVVPTAQGGGADRLARVFDDFWGPLLKTNFETRSFPAPPGRWATSSARYFDPRAVVVLAVVSALEVMGEKARIEPDARVFAGGESALGGQGGEGKSQAL
jgi:tripartite-type tricarboxylate transporter receptor subunit TctC